MPREQDPHLHVRNEDVEELVAEVANGRISRRRFLERGLALGLSLSAVGCVLAACGEEEVSQSASPAAMDTQLPDKLAVFGWTDYAPPSVYERFEKEYGVKVVQTYYDNNEDLLAKLKGMGGAGYDTVNPSDYMASIMIKTGLLLPLDKSLLPNLSNIVIPILQKPAFDPETDGKKYTVPYGFGTTGIAVRTDKVDEPITSWEALWDSKYKRKIVMLNAERECFFVALTLLGYSPNTVEPSEIEEAKQKLIEQKPLVLKYDSQSPRRSVVQGNPLTHCWDGDVVRAKQELGEELVDYALPDEGFMVWADAMAIPVRAPSPYAAHLLLNFLLEPENAAEWANYSGYQISACPADLLTDPIQQAMLPTAEQLNKGGFVEDLGEANRLYTEAWEEVMSA